jgi:hypothetical protein
VMLLYQGAVGGLDLGATGAGGNSQHLIGIGAGQGSELSWGQSPRQADGGATKNPRRSGGRGCVNDLRTVVGVSTEGDQNLN